MAGNKTIPAKPGSNKAEKTEVEKTEVEKTEVEETEETETETETEETKAKETEETEETESEESLVEVTNNHNGPLTLPLGPTIQPGKSVKVTNWAVLQNHAVIKAWLQAEVISVEGDETEEL